MENCELMHMDKHHLTPTRNKRVLILHEYVISSVNYLSPLKPSHLLRKEQTNTVQSVIFRLVTTCTVPNIPKLLPLSPDGRSAWNEM